MKRLIVLSLSIFFLGFYSASFAQNDQDAMMKKWVAYMTPSEMHQGMAKYDGVWNTSLTLWMSPKDPPATSTGTCTNKMVMGGRYQESIYAGSFMNQPMEGKATLAYDNAKKVFQSTWIDNMGTGIMLLTGTWDDATHSLTLTGMMTDPMTGKDTKVREIMQIADDDHHTMTMYNTTGDGKEFKSMEIKYTRK